MDSNSARNVLVGVLGVVIGALLVAVGFLAAVVIDDDESGDGVAVSAADTAPPAETASDDLDFDILDEIVKILGEDFVEPDRIDRALLFEGAINGIFQALNDPHSVYIDPQTYSLSRDDFSGAYQGIGATVTRQDNFVAIAGVFPESGAERAGVLPGDLILEVDGESAEGWSVEKAVLRIRGRIGTAVELLVRHSDGSEERLVIVRDEVLVASVDTLPPGGVLKDANDEEVSDIGYIRIRRFTSRTPEELTEEIERLGDVRALILDVRSNPGGLLVETVLTADLFLDGGAILIQVDRTGAEQVFTARPGTITDLPVAILQDEFSASGSELLAAALQENGRGIVVGSPSFGKGTVSHARDLSNGGAVYVSIARWLTPNRNLIEGLGVLPDIEVTLTADDIEARRDIALYRAIDALRAQVETPGTSAS